MLDAADAGPDVLDGALFATATAILSAGVIELVPLVCCLGAVGALIQFGLAIGATGIATLAVARFIVTLQACA